MQSIVCGSNAKCFRVGCCENLLPPVLLITLLLYETVDEPLKAGVGRSRHVGGTRFLLNSADWMKVKVSVCFNKVLVCSGGMELNTFTQVLYFKNKFQATCTSVFLFYATLYSTTVQSVLVTAHLFDIVIGL